MKTRKTITGLLIVWWLLVGGTCASIIDLDPLLEGSALWEMSEAEFGTQYIHEGGFQWVSATKDSARLVGIKWGLGDGQPNIGEILVRFRGKQIGAVEMSIYNRGDDGKISMEQYLERLKAATDFLDSRLSVRKEVIPAAGSSTVRGLVWKAEQGHYQLDYSYQKKDFRPEFIILKIEPVSAFGDGGGTKSRSDLQKEVVRNSGGDVVIKSVPMVDQGKKGYCAVASAERVMRYYGIDVNQHEMAQISNTSARGTSGKEMSEALGAAAGKYHTRVLTLFEFNYQDEKGWEEMSKVAESYNRLARKAGEREFDTENYWISIGKLLSQGDPQLLKELRASGSKYDRFRSKLWSYIDKGVPLLWAVYLGVFEEAGLPQASGGHMRLIIGYNKEREELIYTDSWGAGHELKRMKMDEAYTMTLQLTVLQPAN